MTLNRTASLVARLRQQILEDILPIGAKLPSESDLISTHGVSRTVVREALLQLRTEGLIHTRRGTGSFVLTAPTESTSRASSPPRTPAERLELIEFRIAVECEASALASQRRSASQLTSLSDAVAAFSDAAEHPATAVEHDFAFHRGIAEASANPYLLEAVTTMGPTMISMPRTRLQSSSSRHQLAAQEHRSILEAIRESDATGAAAAMRAHLSASRRRVLDL